MKTLDVQHDIWDTEYTLTEHDDGSVTVKMPTTKWRNNSGSLAFCTAKFTGDVAAFIRRFFDEQTLVLDDAGRTLTLDNVMAGYY